MATSTNEASPKSPRAISTDLRNVTFSQASADGLTHYDWLDGQTIDQSGREAALASHSVVPAEVRDSKTSDIFGPLFDGSSPSANLCRSLESRLRARLEGRGATEYKMTWKHWDTPSGRQIFALRASTPRTSGKGSGGEPLTWQEMLDGWPKTPKTPMASDGEGGVMEIRPGTTGKYKLRDFAMTVGWPTANARDWKGATLPDTVRKSTGKVRVDQLDRAAEILTGWKTPAAEEPGIDIARLVNKDGTPWTGGQRAYDKETGRLCQTACTQMAHLTGWSTPQASDNVEGSRTAPESNQKCLGRDMHCVGWLTPAGAGGGQLNRGGSRKNEPLCAGEALLTGWPTATVGDSKSARNASAKRTEDGKHNAGTTMVDAADTTGWPTPRTVTGGAESANRKQELGRKKSGGGDLQAVALETLGLVQFGGPVPMGNFAGFLHELDRMEKPRLNPAFSLWLMGFPSVWAYCGVQAMLSYRKTRRRSSSRSKKPSKKPSK